MRSDLPPLDTDQLGRLASQVNQVLKGAPRDVAILAMAGALGSLLADIGADAPTSAGILEPFVAEVQKARQFFIGLDRERRAGRS